MGLAINLILPVILYSLSAGFTLLLLPSDPLAATAIGGAVILPLLYFFYRKEAMGSGAPADSFRLAVRSCIFMAGLGISACILVNNIISICSVTDLFPGYEETEAILYSPPLWEQLLAIVVVIPAVEELIFRGLAFVPLRRRFPFWSAALGSALFFGIYHGNVAQGLYAFLLAWFMAWLYERYQTLLAPYLFHFFANLTSVVLTFAQNSGRQGGFWILGVGTVAAFCLTAVFLRLIYKNTHLKEELLT